MNFLTQVETWASDAERLALVSDRGQITYADMITKMQRMSSRLINLGFMRHNAVGISAGDSIDSLILRLSLMQIGCLPVSLSARLPDEEFERRRRFANCDHVVGHVELVDLVLNNLDEEPLYTQYHTRPIALWAWSGGTSGLADGIFISHDSIPATANVMTGLGGVVYSAAPMTTSMGLNWIFFTLCRGGTAVIDGRTFMPLNVEENITRHRVTQFLASPPIYKILMQRNKLDRGDIPVQCIVGGDVCSTQLATRWQEWSGRYLYNLFGASQAGCMFWRVPSDPLGSIGRPFPDMEVELRDEHGNTVADGEFGEFWTRGPQRAHSDRSLSGESSIRDGWITTHDMMMRDRSGVYWYMGRSNDTFKIDGHRISPLKIEDQVREVPGVADVIAVPAQDASGLNEVRVYVVAEHNDPYELTWIENAINMKAQVLQNRERPKKVVFVSELPRHPVTQKLQRYRLR